MMIHSEAALWVEVVLTRADNRQDYAHFDRQDFADLLMRKLIARVNWRCSRSELSWITSIKFSLLLPI